MADDPVHIGWRTDVDHLEKRIDWYFDKVHSVLWGRSFDVVHPDSRQEAKDYIIKLLSDLKIILIDEEIADDPLIGANGIDYT